MRIRILSVMIVSAASVLAVGCGGVYDSTVTGNVSLDGNVVPRGTVAFHPRSGGPAAYSPIAENGSYSIRTGRESGLPAGEYDVTVSANERPSDADIAKGGAPPPGKAITPIRYRSKESSGLNFTVEPGSNEINLELTSQGPAGRTSR